LGDENERTSTLDQQRNKLDDELKDLNYRLNNMTKDRSGADVKKQQLEKKLKDTEKDLKKLQQDNVELQNVLNSKNNSNISLSTDLEDSKRKIDDLMKENKNLISNNKKFE